MSGKNCFNGVTFRWIAGVLLSLIVLLAGGMASYAMHRVEKNADRIVGNQERLATMEAQLRDIVEGMDKLLAGRNEE